MKKDTTKIGIGIAAIIILAVIAVGSNTKFFKGLFQAGQNTFPGRPDASEPLERKPDLIMEDLVAVESPGNCPAAGSCIIFRGTIKNLGRKESRSRTRLRVDIGNRGLWDYTLEDPPITLHKNGIHVVSWRHILPTANTTYKYEICADTDVDGQSTVPELNEKNNCSTAFYTPSVVTPPSTQN